MANLFWGQRSPSSSGSSPNSAARKHCISCANGTDALLLVLMAEGIGPGDAVFVPAFTFVATAEVAVLAGATPVFVDVHPDSFNMDVESLEAAIGEAKRRGLKPRASSRSISTASRPTTTRSARSPRRMISSCWPTRRRASARASTARKSARSPTYTATSFYPSKPLGGYGDGGAIFTDDDDKADAARLAAQPRQGAGPAESEYRRAQ